LAVALRVERHVAVLEPGGFTGEQAQAEQRRVGVFVPGERALGWGGHRAPLRKARARARAPGKRRVGSSARRKCQPRVGTSALRPASRIWPRTRARGGERTRRQRLRKAKSDARRPDLLLALPCPLLQLAREGLVEDDQLVALRHGEAQLRAARRQLRVL